jgi:hypothetical protein
MYTEILRSIQGVGVFPLVSLVLFVSVFTGVIVWAIRVDRKTLDRNAALPFSEAPHAPPGVPNESLRGRHA